MSDCIFCKIAAKQIEAKIFSERESSVAFLDINPVSPGHSLVIPKSHFTNVADAPDDVLAELISHAKEVALMLKDVLNASGFNIVNANGRAAQQSVFHLHFHVVPRFDDDRLNLFFHGRSGRNIDMDHVYESILKRCRKNPND
ncbi:MAG: HIT family protein [Spirochaetales bacterium]|nr:HIT family protein [Spirochaetales bacterium]